VPLSGDYGFHIVDAGKVFAGISNLQELEIGPHVIQLHREIFRLHLDFENPTREKRLRLANLVTLSRNQTRKP
jgi:hypothetical protein